MSGHPNQNTPGKGLLQQNPGLNSTTANAGVQSRYLKSINDSKLTSTQRRKVQIKNGQHTGMFGFSQNNNGTTV